MFSGLQKLQAITVACNGKDAAVKGWIDCDYKITVFSIVYTPEISPYFLDHEIDHESCVCKTCTLSEKICNFVIWQKSPVFPSGGGWCAEGRVLWKQRAAVGGTVGRRWVGGMADGRGARVLAGSVWVNLAFISGAFWDRLPIRFIIGSNYHAQNGAKTGCGE